MTRKSANILLVEDNEMDIELTLAAFQEARLENKISVVTTGEEALDFLHGNNKYTDRRQYPVPDIVLLDIKLPGISGLEVLKQMKQTSVMKRLPVIILTSSTEEGDRAAGYDNGANSYLVKPVSFEGFLEVVGKVYEYWLTLNVAPPSQ